MYEWQSLLHMAQMKLEDGKVETNFINHDFHSKLILTSIKLILSTYI